MNISLVQDHNWNKKYMVYLQALIVTICMVVVFTLVLDSNKPEHYALLWLLPLVFAVCFCTFTFFIKSIHLPLTSLFFFGLYFVRLVAVPLFMRLGNYTTYALDEVIAPSMREAIVLTCWEFSALTVILYLANLKQSTRLGKINPNEQNIQIKTEYRLPRLLPWVLLAGLVYFVVIMLATPYYFRANFFPILGPTRMTLQARRSGMVSNQAFGLEYGHMFVTLALKVFWVLHILVPSFLIYLIVKKVKKPQFRTALALLVILLTTIIATEYRSNSIQAGLAVLIAASTIYKKELRLNPLIVAAMLGVLAFAGLAIKSAQFLGDVQLLEDTSKTMSAYFNGPQYLATAITAAKDSDLLGPQKILPDILERLPLGARLLPQPYLNSSRIYNMYFGERYLGMILPSIGMGYVYFGFLLAPIIPGIALVFSILFEKKLWRTKDIFAGTLNVIAIIMFARAMTMSNMLSGIVYMIDYFYAWAVLFLCELYEKFRQRANTKKRI